MTKTAFLAVLTFLSTTSQSQQGDGSNANNQERHFQPKKLFTVDASHISPWFSRLAEKRRLYKDLTSGDSDQEN
ncbi:MAG: hypothetical protein KF820_06960 [Candidatus Paracaedibacteraceae bacterium]|nr:hypothetical protein [Candidatus Paracaedibacteraceae bacterium]